MEDFNVQQEIKTEKIVTECSLITSVDFEGNASKLLCMASQKTLYSYTTTEQVCHVELVQVPLALHSIRTPPNIMKLNELEESLVVVYQQFAELYTIENSMFKQTLKFTLPQCEFSAPEQELFTQYGSNQLSYQDLQEKLKTISLTQLISDLSQQIITSQHQLPLLYQDEITASDILDATNQEQRELTGQCLCLCTASRKFYILNPDFSSIIFSETLQNPGIQIQMEGVIQQLQSAKVDLKAEQIQQTQQNTWRATIVTANNQLISIRNSKLSQNKIDLYDQMFCFRLEKSIFTINRSIIKNNARGRAESEFPLNFKPQFLTPFKIEVGRGFSGFLLMNSRSECCFVNESGFCKQVNFGFQQIEAVWCGNINNAQFILLVNNGKIFIRQISKQSDFSQTKQDGRLEQQNRPFDVESLDSFYKPQSKADQQISSALLQPARAAARSYILQELVLNQKSFNTKTEQTVSKKAICSAFLEGNGPFTLCVSVQNPNDDVLQASMLEIDCPGLMVLKQSIFIPPLVPGQKFEAFQQLMSKGVLGEPVEPQTIQLRFGEEEINVEVPGFIG